MNKTKKEGQQAANENTEEILDNKNQETQN